uniref:Uncharacterized protein n=1 Tax=Rhizophora mucronata TaxID=61149 RepID=A0A2P2QIL5_RHIMU
MWTAVTLQVNCIGLTSVHQINSEIVPEGTLFKETSLGASKADWKLQELSSCNSLVIPLEFTTINDTGVSSNLFASLETKIDAHRYVDSCKLKITT